MRALMKENVESYHADYRTHDTTYYMKNGISHRTEAAINTLMLAYNLMSLLRQMLLKNSTTKHSSNNTQHTLQTLRYKLFTTTESRKPILNVAVAVQQRAWIQGLWDASKAFKLPAKFTPIYPA